MTHGKLSGSTLNRSCAKPRRRHRCTWRRHSHLRQLVHHGRKNKFVRVDSIVDFPSCIRIFSLLSLYSLDHQWWQHGATPVHGGFCKFSMLHLWGDFTIEWSLFMVPVVGWHSKAGKSFCQSFEKARWDNKFSSYNIPIYSRPIRDF